MALEHEHYSGLGMHALVRVWSWMHWYALVIGCNEPCSFFGKESGSALRATRFTYLKVRKYLDRNRNSTSPGAHSTT